MRLPPLPADQWDEAAQQALSAMLPRGRNPRDANNALATFAHHPALAKAFLRFNVHLLYSSTLPPRIRELAILRVAHRRDCAYEWSHHVDMAKERGDHRRPDRGGADAARPATTFDRAVLTAVDELDEKSQLSDQTWAALGERLDDRQRMDFVFTVGCYTLLAMAFNTFGVQLEHADQEQIREVERCPTSPSQPPAAGQKTTPNSGTAPVDYTDSIDPAFFEAEREAIFKKTWLNVGRVERLPRTGSYFTKELPSAGQGHVGDHRQDQGRLGQGVSQRLPPPRKQAGVERLSTRGDLRHLPAVHLQVPRLALQPRRRSDLHPAGRRVLRPRQGRLRPGARSLRGVGRLHLHQLRQQRGAAHRLPRAAGQEHRGLPLRRDDRDLLLPGRGRQQLEAVHRRVRRVLPRADPAPGAVHQGRSRQDPEVRLRGAALRGGQPAQPAVDLGWSGAAPGHVHGQADGPGAAQRAVRSVGQAGDHREARSCRRVST